MAETALASGLKQDISGGAAFVSPEATPAQKLRSPESIPESRSKPDQAKLEQPKKGMLRGFTSALGSLARALSLGENDFEPADTPTEPDSLARPTEATSGPVPTPVKNIKIKPGPQLNAIRSDLLSLLAELDRDKPTPAAARNETSPGPVNGNHKPQVHLQETSTPAQLIFLDEALSSQTDLSEAEPRVSGSVPDGPVEDAAAQATSSQEKSAQDVDHSAEPSSGQYAILSGKTIAVVGFPPTQSMAIGQALAAQHCSFLTLTHTDAEFRKGAITGCDALILNVRPESVQTGSGEVSSLLSIKKPALLVGDTDVLMGAAMLAQNNPREFVAASNRELTRESIWRTALLLSSLPGPKVRPKKKNRQMQIVIGDDDPSSRTLVHAILAQEGMQCHAADNGAHALALARSKSADVLIVDVNMPGLDGFQVLAEIKRDPSLTAMRVILLTTRQAEADVLRGFGLGADDYVTKPFSPLELAARVKRLLGRNS